MSNSEIRNTLSLCPFEIHMYDDDGIISSGAAFFYKDRATIYLITNWHNLSGKHFLTKEPLNERKRLPTYIKIKLFQSNRDKTTGYTSKSTRVDIYKSEQPLWFEHSDYGSECDVVALPMHLHGIDTGPNHNPVNLVPSVEITISPGSTVFVIGFPKTLSTGPGLPVWKSGHLASEPEFEVRINGIISDIGGLSGGKKLPAMFLDIQTREGMSGSPIFAFYSGVWDRTNPYKMLHNEPAGQDNLIYGVAFQFFGCYSARVGDKEESASLGLCWSKEIIRQVCNGRPGKHPHINVINN